MLALKRFLFLFVFLVLNFRAAGAETVLSQYVDPVAGVSLQELIDAMFENNPSLVESRFRLVEAQALRKQAGSRPNPELQFEAGTSAITGESGDQEWSVSYSQPLELGKRDNRIRVADLRIQVVSEEDRERRRALLLELSRTFAETLAAIESLRAMEEAVDVASGTHEITVARVEQGEAAAIEKSLSEVEINRLRSEATLQHAQLLSELATIKLLAGKPADAELKIRGVLMGASELQSKELPELLEIGRNHRPDLKAAILSAELARAEIEAAKSEGRTDLNAFLQYTDEKSRFDQFGLDANGVPVPIQDSDRIVSGGISLQLPLFNRNQGNVQAAQSREQAAQAKVLSVRRMVDLEIGVARERLSMAKSNYEQFKNSILAQSGQQLEVIRASYQAGESRIMDLLNQQRTLLQVRQSFITVAKEYLLASAELEYATAYSIRVQGDNQ